MGRTKHAMHVSVIIPTLNETGTIDNALPRLKRQQFDEVIVADVSGPGDILRLARMKVPESSIGPVRLTSTKTAEQPHRLARFSTSCTLIAGSREAWPT